MRIGCFFISLRSYLNTDLLKSNIFSTLSKEGYQPCLNNTAVIFAQSCDVVFSRLDDQTKKDIIDYLKSISEIPLNDPHPYYYVTKKVFSDLFGTQVSEIIMKSIGREMLKLIDFDFTGGIEELLDEIQKRDLDKNLSMPENTLVLYLWEKFSNNSTGLSLKNTGTLWIYNSAKIGFRDDETLKKVLEEHEYVILQKSNSLFKRNI